LKGEDIFTKPHPQPLSCKERGAIILKIWYSHNYASSENCPEKTTSASNSPFEGGGYFC